MEFIKDSGSSRNIQIKKKNLLSSIPKGLRSLIEAVVIVLILRWLVVEAHAVPTGSMIPTIIPQEYLLAEKISYRFYDPQPGDVVVFKYPVDGKTDYVKRCVAVGGQSVEFKDRVLYVDGVAVPDSHAHYKCQTDPVPFLFDISPGEWQRHWEARGTGLNGLAQYIADYLQSNQRTILKYFAYYTAVEAEKQGVYIDRDSLITLVSKEPMMGRTWQDVGNNALTSAMKKLFAEEYDTAFHSSIINAGLQSVPDFNQIIGYSIADNSPKVTVPEGMIMCVGDNRCESFDSRYWGPVSVDKVKGRPVLLYYSLVNKPPEPGERPTMFDNILVLVMSIFRPQDIRFDRFFRFLF